MSGRDARGAMGRRGLLAGAAALVAGGLARLGGPGRAEAAHSGSDETIIHANVFNSPTATTAIVGNLPSDPTLAVTNNSSILALGNRDTIQAFCGAVDDVAAVRGVTVGQTGRAYGLLGITSSSTPDASGVKGEASRAVAYGVWGNNLSSAANATGVLGSADSTAANPTVGVRGRSRSSSTGAIGALGESTNGSGVRGDSTGGNGVFGVSSNATGAFGFSNNSFGAAGVSNAGVGVFARSSGNWGLHAESPIFAGVFSGSVFVNGNFTVANGAKSASVRNKRGEHRRVYCQESPEPWFEDFGRGELRNGRAEVALDPEFDAVVKGDDYRVFLTPWGDCRGLYVSRQGPHRFEVRELQGGTSSLSFGYRVVARRLDDVGRRLEKIDVPDFSKAARPQPPPGLPSAADERERPGQ